MQKLDNRSDFATGSVCRHIVALAVPMTIAQLVQVLYNLVDRVYIGHLPGASFLALTGLGLTFPIVTLIAAFTNLFGMGGAPLCSIARGRQDNAQAEHIMGVTLFMLAVSSMAVLLICYLFMRPILYLFGASDQTYPYAAEYLHIYLIGTPFVIAGRSGKYSAGPHLYLLAEPRRYRRGGGHRALPTAFGHMGVAVFNRAEDLAASAACPA